MNDNVVTIRVLNLLPSFTSDAFWTNQPIKSDLNQCCRPGKKNIEEEHTQEMGTLYIIGGKLHGLISKTKM